MITLTQEYLKVLFIFILCRKGGWGGLGRFEALHGFTFTDEAGSWF